MNTKKTGQERSSQLIQEATALIREGGIRALTMRKVAERVGITEASAYRYYPDKSALLAAVIDQMKRQLLGPMQDLLKKGLSPEVLLERLVAHHLRFVLEQEGLPMVFIAEIASANDEVLTGHIRGILLEYQDLLDQTISQIPNRDQGVSVPEYSTLFIGLATAMAIQQRVGIRTKTHARVVTGLLPFIVNCITDRSAHKGEQNE